MKDRRIRPKTEGLSGRQLLERWLVRSRMTQEEAAGIIGISRVKFNQYLNGAYRPSLETAIRIEDVTGIGARLWLVDEPPAMAESEASDYNVSDGNHQSG
jgi:plasmid maintenance system antidote protein VapI